MMSEYEASKRWCPFVRHSQYSENGTAANRGPGVLDDRCMASSCAVWTWEDVPTKHHLQIDPIERDRTITAWARDGWTVLGEVEQTMPGSTFHALTITFTRPEQGRCGLTNPRSSE
jgi:hypothetical protein